MTLLDRAVACNPLARAILARRRALALAVLAVLLTACAGQPAALAFTAGRYVAGAVLRALGQ